MHWRRAGDAPVLYLHGVPTRRSTGIPFLERTGGMAPDLPGFGRSAKPGDFDYSIDGYDRFLEPSSTSSVSSASRSSSTTGARSAWRFAQRFPERIERLVLFTCVPLLPGYRWHRVARGLAHARGRRADDGLHHPAAPSGASCRPSSPTAPGRASTRAPSGRSCGSTARRRRRCSRARGRAARRAALPGAVLWPTRDPVHRRGVRAALRGRPRRRGRARAGRGAATGPGTSGPSWWSARGLPAARSTSLQPRRAARRRSPPSRRRLQSRSRAPARRGALRARRRADARALVRAASTRGTSRRSPSRSCSRSPT